MFERPSSQSELIGAQLLKQAEHKSNLAAEKYRINMKPFVDLYGIQQVQSDYAEVKNRLEMYENNGTNAEKLGKIFENAFIDSANNHNWLGERSELTKASLYDDFHGIDMISTFVPEGKQAQSLVLGSDLTFSKNSVGKKFEKTLRGVCAGHLATIKYFHSDLEHTTGRKTNVPRTIIGLDKNNLPEMIRLWVHDPSNPLEEYKSILIHQIHNQVTSLRSHLGETLGKDHKAYAAYDKAAEIVSDLKEKIIPFRELPHDMITEEIFSAMDSLK